MSASPATHSQYGSITGAAGPKGIGGWLLLSLLLLLLSAYRASQTLLAFWNDPSTIAIEPSGFPFPNRFIEELAAATETGATYLLIPVVLICLVQLALKSRLAPRLMILLYGLNALNFGIELARELYRVGVFISYMKSVPSLSLTVVYLIGFLISLIWIRYFQVSRRVKNTFVH
jgi:hypothetical protein